MDKIKSFLRNDDGAVTIDWVVLSAAIIGIGLLVLIPIGNSTDSSATKIAGDISDQSVGYGR
ncbi:Flp family type IVb pilin [Pseudorhodobacter sp.]|uniref:Flp family type IVb pilin n=1 Tax=Pseudorhodobacter sp. TaxID=1934400 RepID=UPI002648EA6B|nr:hypothetical protein [Pseudorhodobacter sp.]MDN5788488.1 hypothetical protein [Pseudorhodobacter sp.]